MLDYMDFIQEEWTGRAWRGKRYLSVFGPDVNEFGSYVYDDGTPFSLTERE